MSSSGSCGITSRRGGWDRTRCHRSEGRARLKDIGVTGLQGPAAVTPCPGTWTCCFTSPGSGSGHSSDCSDRPKEPQSCGTWQLPGQGLLQDKAPVLCGATLALQSSPGGWGSPGERAELPIPKGKGTTGLGSRRLQPIPLLFTAPALSTFPEQRHVLLDLRILNTFLYLRNNGPRPADNLCPNSAHCRAAT